MTDQLRSPYERLGEAFGTIEELYEYMPDALYNGIAELLNEHLVNNLQWQNDPPLAKKVYSHLVERAHALEENVAAIQEEK